MTPKGFNVKSKSAVELREDKYSCKVYVHVGKPVHLGHLETVCVRVCVFVIVCNCVCDPVEMTADDCHVHAYSYVSEPVP